jgi:hypothetical protein
MTTPIVTRRADGSLSVQWPDPCPREHLVAHELLVEMIGKHNEIVDLLGSADVESLRRRLTYGERVEQCVKVGILVSTEGKYHGRFVRTADDLLDSLTRPAGSSGTETP